MKIHETSWIFMKTTDVKMTQKGLVKVHPSTADAGGKNVSF